MDGLDTILDLGVAPSLPTRGSQRPIAIVGAGAIVRTAHLPAYRAAGLDVRAIYDLDLGAARTVAAEFDIPEVSSSLHDLLGHDDVEIVDVAVPAAASPAIVEQALAAGHHVLAQKPLAETSERAGELVRCAEAAGRLLAVNHQMRWSPAVRVASEAIRLGLLGDLVDYTFRVDRLTDFGQWPWLEAVPYPELWYNTLHYLDATRAWFGDPERVFGSLRRHPASSLSRPSRTLIVCDYAGGGQGLIQSNHESLAPPDDWEAWFLIVGTSAQLRGRIGSLVAGSDGSTDRIDFASRTAGQPARLTRELPGDYFPDAFLGPMASLMTAIDEDGEPETSARDALRTLQLVEAVERSHESGRPVAMPRQAPVHRSDS